MTDAKGKSLEFFMTAGPVSNGTGTVAFLGRLMAAGWLIAGRGYQAGKGTGFSEPARIDGFRDA